MQQNFARTPATEGDAPVQGAVTAVKAGLVEGWIDAAAAGRMLAVYIGGRRIATGPAQLDAGGDRAAFAIDARGCPADLLRSDELALDVALLGRPSRRIASTRVAILDFLALRDMPPGTQAGTLQGCVDEQGASRVRGWVCDASRPERQLDVYLFSGERFLGRHSASQPRPDLAAAGRGHGGYGFDIALAEPVEAPTVIAGEPERWRIPLGAHAATSPAGKAPARWRDLPDSFEAFARALTTLEPFPKKAFVIDKVKQGAVPDPFSADYVALALECLRGEMAAIGESAGGGVGQRLRAWAEMRAVGMRIRRLEELAAAIAEGPRLLAVAAKRHRREDA